MLEQKVERVARFLREKLRDCGAEVPDERDMERAVQALTEQEWVVLVVEGVGPLRFGHYPSGGDDA